MNLWEVDAKMEDWTLITEKGSVPWLYLWQCVCQAAIHSWLCSCACGIDEWKESDMNGPFGFCEVL